MSIRVMNLNKLLKFCALPENELVASLRRDLREDRKRLEIVNGGGGDFHCPFWSDAKGHVFGLVDLNSMTKLRIESNPLRKRLYPMLQDGFLDWLKELRRGTNERTGRLPQVVHNHYAVPGLDLTVKVDNVLGLQIGSDKHRIVYPYFSESPILLRKWARVGLWLMSEALDEYSVTEMEILDVIRGRSYSGKDLFFKGDEESVFSERYGQILSAWSVLKDSYAI
jgi:hypothetical protein